MGWNHGLTLGVSCGNRKAGRRRMVGVQNDEELYRYKAEVLLVVDGDTVAACHAVRYEV